MAGWPWGYRVDAVRHEAVGVDNECEEGLDRGHRVPMRLDHASILVSNKKKKQDGKKIGIITLHPDLDSPNPK